MCFQLAKLTQAFCVYKQPFLETNFKCFILHFMEKKTAKYISHSEKPPFISYGLYVRYSSYTFAPLHEKVCIAMHKFTNNEGKSQNLSKTPQ